MATTMRSDATRRRTRHPQPAAAKPPELFWNTAGQIACASHAPVLRSDTWRTERWSKLTPATLAVYKTTRGRAPKCEHCLPQLGGGAS